MMPLKKLFKKLSKKPLKILFKNPVMIPVKNPVKMLSMMLLKKKTRVNLTGEVAE